MIGQRLSNDIYDVEERSNEMDPVTPVLDLSAVDTTAMLQIIYDFIPVGLPIMLVLLGVRIGISIFKGMVS